MKYWHRAIQERIAEVVYGLDAGGNPLRIDEYYDAAGNYHRSYYDYDVLGRLIEWLYPSPSKVWAYDWVGNWVSSRDGTFVTDPDVDWLDSSPVPSATYDYNKLGALEDMTVSANTDTFSYDDQELLSQVSYGGGGSSTMTWDADQQRQKLTNSGGSTYFVYDPTAGVPAVLVETDGENETFYVREPGGELIARAQGQTRQYYFFDRLGSTIAIVPAVEANPTDRLFYTPWGELVASGTRASTVGTTANPYRYVGQLGYYYHHQDAGLQDWMQLGVRFYQPELGRFERRDPRGTARAAAYPYAGGGPGVYVDPCGEKERRLTSKEKNDLRDCAGSLISRAGYAGTEGDLERWLKEDRIVFDNDEMDPSTLMFGRKRVVLGRYELTKLNAMHRCDCDFSCIALATTLVHEAAHMYQLLPLEGPAWKRGRNFLDALANSYGEQDPCRKEVQDYRRDYGPSK